MIEQVKHGRDGEVTVSEVCERCADPISGCCRQLPEAIAASHREIERISKDNTAGRIGHGCLLAGPKRGDCAHAVGLPGRPHPGQHDGPDDTVDAYGRPNGWCQICWLGHQLSQAQERHDAVVHDLATALGELRERVAKADALMVETYAGAYVHGPTCAIWGKLRVLLRGEEAND